MSRGRVLLVLALILLVGGHRVLASPFVVFPKAERLASPDGKFEVRNEGRQGADSDFVGTFHSLWLTETGSGRSRKLCDYVGVAAVAWSDSNFLVVTQYLSKRTSRALVFSAGGAEGPILLDIPTLVQSVPSDLRPTLRENDHAFVEASRLENEAFYFRVWGYGKHDPKGFRWNCLYSLSQGKVSCAAAGTTTFGN